MIEVLGHLKGVNTKSKDLDGGGKLHQLEIKLEIVEGEDKLQEVIEHLQEVVKVSIVSKQPHLKA